MSRRFGLYFQHHCWASFVALLIGSFAWADTALQYTVTLANPAEHRVHVKLELPPGPAERELQLPVWNATYQVRDFAHYVLWVRTSGSASIRKINKSLWRVSGAEKGTTVEYETIADIAGPYGFQLTSEHAFFNLAELLMYSLDARNASMRVRFDGVPSGWHVACALPTHGLEITADKYDRLVDSPVEIGTFKELAFDESGGHYRVAIHAAADAYDAEKLTDMLRRIVVAETGWMGDRPYREYLFIYHFPDQPNDGGMEHAYSTAITVNKRTLRKDPDSLPSVTAHEFFHLWNVKRIRPHSLEPIDYSRENYTRALWFSEGMTSTVADLVRLKAGLLDEKAFLQDFSEEITHLQQAPANTVQSAEESSLDAWLEKYPFYRRPERSISYYNKGYLLGFMLDLAIRRASNDEGSLRDVFRFMNETYAQKGRFFEDSEGVRQAVESISGHDFSAFFRDYVAGTKEIPYDEFLAWVGLRVVEERRERPDIGFDATRNFGGPMVVSRVTPQGAAAKGGLAEGDILLAINGEPPGEDLQAEANYFSVGEEVAFRVRRGTQDLELKWKIRGREITEYKVVDAENITADQRLHRTHWLKSLTLVPSGAQH